MLYHLSYGPTTCVCSQHGTRGTELTDEPPYSLLRIGSLTRLDLHHHTPLGPNQLAWNPDMEEADDRPPAMILIDNYFAVYRNRRRPLISGDAPQFVVAAGLRGRREGRY